MPAHDVQRVGAVDRVGVEWRPLGLQHVQVKRRAQVRRAFGCNARGQSRQVLAAIRRLPAEMWQESSEVHRVLAGPGADLDDV